MPDLQKDVYSINELDALNRLLQNLNDFLVDQENDEYIVLSTVVINIKDQHGRHWGALTKWDRNEDVKFEPDFEAELS